MQLAAHANCSVSQSPAYLLTQQLTMADIIEGANQSAALTTLDHTEWGKPASIEWCIPYQGKPSCSGFDQMHTVITD